MQRVYRTKMVKSGRIRDNTERTGKAKSEHEGSEGVGICDNAERKGRSFTEQKGVGRRKGPRQYREEMNMLYRTRGSGYTDHGVSEQGGSATKCRKEKQKLYRTRGIGMGED